MPRHCLILLCFAISIVFHGHAQNTDGFVVEEITSNVVLNDDYTSTSEEVMVIKALTKSGAEKISQNQYTYWPQSETFELVDAYVIQEDGTKVHVPKDQVFIRPSPASREAPGFVDSQTATVVFPQVNKGSTTYAKIRKVKTKPDTFKFYAQLNEGITQVDQFKLTINTPKNLYLNWGTLKGAKVEEEIKNNRRILTVSFSIPNPATYEPNMLDAQDIFPLVAMSSQKTWEEIGQTLHNLYEKQLVIDQPLKDLSDKIVGNKKGIEAAKAIFYWVNQNIRYLAVYLDPHRSYTPNTPQEILAHGYGDCKDQVMILQALMKAQGIEAYPALISATKSFVTLPVPCPLQFNHAILYIPEFDTYLDSTVPYQQFGLLTNILHDKITVIGTPKGLVKHTPKINAKERLYTYAATLALTPKGNLNANSLMTAYGSVATEARNYFAVDDIRALVDETLARNSIGGTGTLQIENLENPDKPFELNGSWQRERLFRKGESFYFQTPNGLSYGTLDALKTIGLLPSRKFPFYFASINTSFTYTINPPEGFQFMQIPKNVHVQNEEGFYTGVYTLKNKQLHIQRTFGLKNQVHHPENYQKLLDIVYEAINDATAVVHVAPIKKIR